MTTIYRLADELRRSAATQLGRAGRGVCRFPVVFGDHPAPADNCDCDCDEGTGTAWIRWVGSKPAHGGRAAAMPDCATGWDATIELGVHRCAPTLDEAGDPPSDDEHDQHAAALDCDAEALRAAVVSCDYLARHSITWRFAEQQPLGPSGGCSGVVLHATFTLYDGGLR